MSNISVRHEDTNKPARVADVTWDPWRAVRALLAWDPFREISPGALASELRSPQGAAFDVKETKDAYEFKGDVPGILEKDLEVTVTGNRLTVSGKREAEEEDKSERYYAYERSWGSFTRSFTLPDGADTEKLRASLDKGVLNITIPKKPEMQAKKIQVQSEGAPKT